MSNDNTLFKIKKLSANNNKIKLISFIKNHGVNTAFSAGLDYATGDCMIFFDVDNQYPLSLN